VPIWLPKACDQNPVECGISVSTASSVIFLIKERLIVGFSLKSHKVFQGKNIV